ncbi:hypothetical protein ACET52_04690 [Aeromonas veronii]
MSSIRGDFFRELGESLERKKERLEASSKLKEEFAIATSGLLKRIQILFANAPVDTVIAPHTFCVGEEDFEAVALEVTCDNRSIRIEPQSFTDNSSANVTGVLNVTVSNPDRGVSYEFLLHWKDKQAPDSEWVILSNDQRTNYTIDCFVASIYPFSE